MVYELKKTIEQAGLNYQYYIDEAESIVRELKKEESVSKTYIKEKIRNLMKVFEDAETEETRQQQKQMED